MKQWKSYFTFVRPYMKWIVFTLFIGMIKFSIPLTLPMILKYVVDDLLMNPAMSIAGIAIDAHPRRRLCFIRNCKGTGGVLPAVFCPADHK